VVLLVTFSSSISTTACSPLEGSVADGVADGWLHRLSCIECPSLIEQTRTECLEQYLDLKVGTDTAESNGRKNGCKRGGLQKRAHQAPKGVGGLARCQ